MKKIPIIILLLVIGGTATAVIFTQFKSWDELTKQSSEIIIAKCTAATASATLEKRMASNDGVIPFEIEVISILKGNTKPGPSQMQSWYFPNQGERFLMFANNYSNDQFYKGYNAIESYRIIPVNRHFNTNELNGKSLNEQIQLILRHRLEDVNEQLKRDNEEKLRIETGLTIEGNSADASTNAFPPNPQTTPQKRKGF